VEYLISFVLKKLMWKFDKFLIKVFLDDKNIHAEICIFISHHFRISKIHHVSSVLFAHLYLYFFHLDTLKEYLYKYYMHFSVIAVVTRHAFYPKLQYKCMLI